jgi:phosphoserine phosphatase
VTALHIFDMDGTLLRGTSGPIEISRRLGCLEALYELERGWAAADITELDFALAIRELWHDLTPELVAAVALDAPWIEGIEAVCADIAARGERSMLITMSPDFFANHLLSLGVDVVCASTFPPLPFRAAVDPAGILTPTDKVRLAESERRAHGLPRRACVAYGDSLSDLPLFAELDNTVAVNADATLERIAGVVYRGEDLTHAYAHGRALLQRAASGPGERA